MTAAVAHQWARLDHDGLGMPLPAVYVPIPDLYRLRPARAGFAPARDVADGGPIPRSTHVLADVADPRTLTLILSSRPLYTPGGPPVTIAEDADTKFITGHYTTPAERAWLKAVARAGGLLLFTGPPPAEPGSTATTSSAEYLLSRETLFGLLFSDTTWVANIAALP